MKSFHITALFLGLFAGCGSPAATPKTFHLKVERDPANNDDLQKTAITFHPPPQAEIVVELDRDREAITFDSKDSNGNRECVVRLVAKRQESQTDEKSKVEILIRPETPNGGRAGGPSIYTVDADKSLNAILDVTVAEGDFALDGPVKLGTLNGEPITLVVRRIQN